MHSRKISRCQHAAVQRRGERRASTMVVKARKGARLVKTRSSKVAVPGLTRVEVDYGQRTATRRLAMNSVYLNVAYRLAFYPLRAFAYPPGMSAHKGTASTLSARLKRCAPGYMTYSASSLRSCIAMRIDVVTLGESARLNSAPSYHEIPTCHVRISWSSNWRQLQFSQP